MKQLDGMDWFVPKELYRGYFRDSSSDHPWHEQLTVRGDKAALQKLLVKPRILPVVDVEPKEGSTEACIQQLVDKAMRRLRFDPRNYKRLNTKAIAKAFRVLKRAQRGESVNLAALEGHLDQLYSFSGDKEEEELDYAKLKKATEVAFADSKEECTLCLEPYTEPVQTVPCRHVACLVCMQASRKSMAGKCCFCRQKIAGLELPLYKEEKKKAAKPSGKEERKEDEQKGDADEVYADSLTQATGEWLSLEEQKGKRVIMYCFNDRHANRVQKVMEEEKSSFGGRVLRAVKGEKSVLQQFEEAEMPAEGPLVMLLVERQSAGIDFKKFDVLVQTELRDSTAWLQQQARASRIGQKQKSIAFFLLKGSTQAFEHYLLTHPVQDTKRRYVSWGLQDVMRYAWRLEEAEEQHDSVMGQVLQQLRKILPDAACLPKFFWCGDGLELRVHFEHICPRSGRVVQSASCILQFTTEDDTVDVHWRLSTELREEVGNAVAEKKKPQRLRLGVEEQ
jgi:hypothetical protein